MQIITPAQCRAARALLNWSQPELAARCDIHVQTISNFEKEQGSPSKNTLEKISQTLEAANIEFLGKDGVRVKTSGIQHFPGQQGYWDFYEDIYKTMKDNGGDIYVLNVDEKIFIDWLGLENTHKHKKRMSELWQKKPFKLRILVEEGDTKFAITEVGEYKWTQKARFSDTPFYIYGPKLAIILFEENNVDVYVINNPKITEAYKKQFNVIWDQGIEIPKDLLVNHEDYRME